MRSGRTWLLWFALALAAAHSMAVWHAYTHVPSEATDSQGKHQVAGTHCGLCLAAADIGGPAPARTAVLVVAGGHRPAVFLAALQPQPAQPRPYAIRAPPLNS